MEKSQKQAKSLYAGATKVARFVKKADAMLPPVPDEDEGASSGDSEVEEENVTKTVKKSKTIKKSGKRKGSSRKY